MIGVLPKQSGELLVDLQEISLRRQEKQILQSISLQVYRGEIVTLIGPNGAGKSTLVEIALGLVQPDSGTVNTTPSLRIGYVPQSMNIDPVMPLPVYRLMTLTQRAKPEDIRKALARVKADHLYHKMVANLSGGEMQRVSLARAMLRNPDILVLDEPTQGVDYVGEAEIYQLISQIRDELNCGILLISHDIHIVMAATDRVVCLNKHICCEGLPETVSQNPEYVALFGHRAASNLGIYTHHHDHDHDINGAIVPKGEGVGHVHGPSCDHH